MIDEKEELKTAGKAPAAQFEKSNVLLCMAIILKVLFDMEAYTGQVMLVYQYLYPSLNGYEIIKRLLDDWKDYDVKLIDINKRCFLIFSKDVKSIFIDKNTGKMFYPFWREGKVNFPKMWGIYEVMKNDGNMTYMFYEPKFGDKGWHHSFDENGMEHYDEVDKWRTYDDLQPFDPSEVGYDE